MARMAILLNPATTARLLRPLQSQSSPPLRSRQNAPLARADAADRNQKLARPSKNAKLKPVMRHQLRVAVAVGWKLVMRHQLRVAIGWNRTPMRHRLRAVVAGGWNRTPMRRQRQAAAARLTQINQNPVPLRNRIRRVINPIKRPNPNPRSVSLYLQPKLLLLPIASRASKSLLPQTVVTSIQIRIVTDRSAPYQLS
jgi:hypothetical protein